MADNTSGHRSVPHTADLRIEAWSPSREGCIGEAVRGTVESFLDTSGARPERIRRCRLALAVMFALVVALLAVPVAAVVATTVYEAHRQMYAEQARARHPVAAVAAETPRAADGRRGTDAAGQAGGRGSFVLRSEPARTAGPEQIWVDDTGNLLPAPTPLSRAQFDAVSVAVSIVAGAIVVGARLVTATRWRPDRVRDARWDRELENIFDDQGGRTNGTGYGRTP